MLSKTPPGSRLLDGFDFVFRVRSQVEPVLVNVDSLRHTLTDGAALIAALSRAVDASDVPVKAMVLTNPHNPIAQCYPRSVIESCMRFCQERDIHFVSDEVYALSVFASPDLPHPTPFVSALHLDPQAVGCHPSRVHVVWGTSKDFGSSGVRMVGVSVLDAPFGTLHSVLLLIAGLD